MIILNENFKKYIDETPLLYNSLLESEYYKVNLVKLPNEPAIYVFYEDNTPVYVGRTRNLRNRIRGHITESHNKATFAFKSARLQTGKNATYKKGEGRDNLIKDANFSLAFKSHIDKIKTMNIKYLIIIDPIKQYLLELYAAMELGTSLTEFDTH